MRQPVEPDAFTIASQFLDSGKSRNELELAILRHMEHHIAAEREACAKIADEREEWAKRMYGSNYRASMAKYIAKEIRGRTR